MATRQKAPPRADRGPQPYSKAKRSKRHAAPSSFSSPPPPSSSLAVPVVLHSNGLRMYCSDPLCMHGDLPPENEVPTMTQAQLEACIYPCIRTSKGFKKWTQHEAWCDAVKTADVSIKIPRPSNKFFLYKSHERYIAKFRGGKIPRGKVHSKMAGELWHAENPDVRAHFASLAAIMSKIHGSGFPGYKYRPQPKRSKTKGDDAEDDDAEDDDAEDEDLKEKPTSSKRIDRPTSWIGDDAASEASSSGSSAREVQSYEGYRVPASLNGDSSAGTLPLHSNAWNASALQTTPPAPSTSLTPEPAMEYDHRSDAGRSHEFEGLSSGSTATDMALYTPQMTDLHDAAASVYGLAGFSNSSDGLDPSQWDAYLLQQTSLATDAHLNAEKRWPSPALFRPEAGLGHYYAQPNILPSIPPLPEFGQGFTYPRPDSPFTPPGSFATPMSMFADRSLGPFAGSGTGNELAFFGGNDSGSMSPSFPPGFPTSSICNQTVDSRQARPSSADYDSPYLGMESVASWRLPTSRARTDSMWSPEIVGSQSPSSIFMHMPDASTQGSVVTIDPRDEFPPSNWF